jgi:orotate phosphoribosyltransferase
MSSCNNTHNSTHKSPDQNTYKNYKNAFIELAIQCQALRFGSFTLKSGRVSPYFFNAGQFRTGKALVALGRFYAAALESAHVPYDMLFGPAYKGIPLATACACALSTEHNKDVPVAFNRKEAKTHGEGGSLIGAPLSGRIAIVDDVITAGTAVREVLALIAEAKAEPAAIIIGLNRQERGQGRLSAIAELEQETGVRVLSLIDLADILTYLEYHAADYPEVLSQVSAYREAYGAD